MPTQPYEITRKEREEIIAAYLSNPKITQVVEDLAYPHGVVRRVLEEEGLKKEHRRKRPPDSTIREIVSPLWSGGASYAEMRKAIGTNVTNALIRGVMRGIPRRIAVPVHQLAAAELPEDESLWRWYAGVIDARGSLIRMTAGGYSITVSTASDRELAQLLTRLVGAGTMVTKRHGPVSVNYSHQIYRRADVLAVLRRVVPFLRHKQTMACRVITELEERGW